MSENETFKLLRSRKMGIKPLEKKVWLSSPTMHGEEIEYVKEAYETNWMSTVGKNINEVERIVSDDNPILVFV